MKKKIITVVAIIVVLGAVVYGAKVLKERSAISALAEKQKACAVDINAIVLADAKGLLKTDKQIVDAMFSHYFEAYKAIPNCLTAGIKDYKLSSIGKIKTQGGNILADIVFDLEPVSIDKTEWATPETTKLDGWVKNKKGMLSIKKNKGSFTLNL